MWKKKRKKSRQEISDFVLTDPKQGALKPFTAIAFNFISGLSVLIGVIVILEQDLSNLDTGMILVYRGGIYLQIAASECMPKVYKGATSVQLRLIASLDFFVGCLAIGLVLLDHKHCTAGGGQEGNNHGGGDGHEGHNHGCCAAVGIRVIRSGRRQQEGVCGIWACRWCLWNLGLSAKQKRRKRVGIPRDRLRYRALRCQPASIRLDTDTFQNAGIEQKEGGVDSRERSSA